MALTSPTKGYQLRRLEGNAGDIDKRGNDLVTLGQQMASTAEALKDIADSSLHKSLGTDKLAEAASETHEDLDKAGVRYELTGDVLVTYAGVLETAQNWIHPRIETITAAEETYQNALDAKSEAQSAADDLDRTWIWEEEPTPADRENAAEALGAATGALTTAKTDRDTLWTEFETTFTTWSDGYDDAVANLEKAMETAGNNDGFWENLNDFLAVLGAVIMVLAIVALFVSGPFALLLMGLIAVMSVIHFVGTLASAMTGHTTWDNVVWSAIGLVTFGAGGALAKIASKGATFGRVFSAGRSTLYQAARATLPRARWFTPFRNIGNWSTARGIARAGTQKPGWLVNPARSIVTGSTDTVRIQNFLANMGRNVPSQYTGVHTWILQQQGLASRGLGFQAAQTALWGTGTTASVGSTFGFLPKFG
ncbi:hypothetical protein D9V29_05820 [Mycetocola manganoxydans]|uniref:Uncharacterized protein n=1 Tax=Mycetocola manganoxydans TaxID=699879 RepID=A0A3L6ZWJ5_9MICO|nr:hypothetical protein [Mycetocola manganoxydans]RLP71951.1 hypothetical protein D9V29_05820 [Mycetocola manganoxydans]GHD47253.1 hypothetical protein GCM10008097_17960 [Mycetocola manganoxydans]